MSLEKLRWEVEHPDTSGAPYVNDPELLAWCLDEIERLNRELEKAIEWGSDR